jgi:hypothetical protein
MHSAAPIGQRILRIEVEYKTFKKNRYFIYANI